VSVGGFDHVIPQGVVTPCAHRTHATHGRVFSSHVYPEMRDCTPSLRVFSAISLDAKCQAGCELVVNLVFRDFLFPDPVSHLLDLCAEAV